MKMKIFNKNDFIALYNNYKVLFFSAIFIGLIAHGTALFNKFSFHDDASSFFRIGGLDLGRWMLKIFETFHIVFFGNVVVSTPLLNGFFSIVFIALAGCIIINLLDIKNKIFQILLIGLMVTLPTVAGMFGYMFTAPYYFFGMLLGICGTYLICKYQNLYSFCCAIILIACSLGCYQAFLSLFLSIIVIHAMKILYDTNDIKDFKKFCLYALFSVFFSLMFYFLIVKISLVYCDISLSNYAGVNKMAQESLYTYFKRIGVAYIEFANPKRNLWIFPSHSIYIYWIMLGLYIFMIFKLFINIYSTSKTKAFLIFFLGIVIFPLCTNFIFIMAWRGAVHILTLYGAIGFFLFNAVILDHFILDDKFYTKSIKFIRNIMMFLFLFLILMYVKFSNCAYLKAEFMQTRTISYFTTLITQIKSTPGYKDEYPLVIINDKNINDKTLSDISELNFITIYPYLGTRYMINNYAVRNFVRHWTGFSPQYADANDFENLQEVIDMKHYPDYGSIKVINDAVVVKF